MFDLNKAIDDWREQLARAEACLGDDVAELEEHLREEMAGLRQAGLNEEEAFLLSTRQRDHSPTGCATWCTPVMPPARHGSTSTACCRPCPKLSSR